jgi:outer membrane lipoprotein-sorting protein
MTRWLNDSIGRDCIETIAGSRYLSNIFLEERMVKFARCAALLLSLLCGGFSGAQAPSQSPPKKELAPDEIIKAFASKESEFYEAWMQYTYRQSANIQIVSVNGYPSKERMSIVSDVIFRDDGSREVRVTQRSGRLKSVLWTDADTEVINNLQPFALTSKDLPLYDLKYEGKERIDELSCYVFSVKPKSTRGGRLYFQGKIWVDDQDLQVVRTVGKPVPQKRDEQFPEFETIRQMVDDKYWFPVWTHADSTLHFDRQAVRIEETITYEDYKKFGAKTKIEFGPPKP